MASSSSNVVGVHYRVGKKIGEGSFGVIFEGTNLLNNQQVAIKFVRLFSQQSFRVNPTKPEFTCAENYMLTPRAYRSQEKATLLNCETSTGRTKYSSGAVSLAPM